MFELGIWNKTDLPPLQKHTPVYNEELAKEYALENCHLQKKGVIYTCITGKYDNLIRIATPGFINYEWDYVCFTDDDELIRKGHLGVWSVRPLAFSSLDPTRNNRWHKTHPHLLFHNYQDSIYIDANVDILTDWLFNEISRRHSDILIPQHPTRNCIYDEYKVAFAQLLDNPSAIAKELRIIKKSKMPRNIGLTENNIIYRKHNSTLVTNMMNEWWDLVSNYSKRDQLSLMWILWKHGITLKEIAFKNPRLNAENFCIFKHSSY